MEEISTEIWIAFIASFTSLFVAIVSLIGSYVNSRNSKKSVIELEKYKFELEEKKVAQSIINKNFQQSIESLDNLIKAIQKVKDSLYMIINDSDNSLDSETAIEMVVEAREHFFNCYEHELSNLQQDHIESIHNAKNKSFTIETLIRKYFQNKSFASELSNDEKQTFFKLRNEFSDLQNILRDYRTTQLSKKLQIV